MMSKKMFMCAFVLSLFIIGGVWAQSTMPDDTVSPTNTSTSGRYKTAIDDYIQPQDYLNLKLNNWFGYVSYAQGNAANTAQPNLGFAKQINNLYLALYYKGGLWQGFNSIPGTSYKAGFNGGDGSYTEYTIPAAPTNPDNSAAILIGIANMGFRIGFSSTYDNFKKSENMLLDGDFFKSASWENGNLVPQIKWGMSKDLIAQGLRPYITATLNFHRDNLKYDIVMLADGTSSGDYTEYSQNYFEPTFAVGLGGFAFYNENGFKASADLDYVLRLRAFNNEYSYIDTDGKSKTKDIKGLNDDGDFSEKSYAFNSIVPSVSGSWSSGNLGLKAKLRANFDITSDKTTAMAENVDHGLLKDGKDSAVTTFTFQPRLDLGLQYKIIPGKLVLNTGGRIAKPITTTTTRNEMYDNTGVKVAQSETVTKNTNYSGSLAYRIYAGAQFFFIDNVWVESSTGVSNGVDFTGAANTANSIVNFTSIAVGLKF